MFLRAYFCLTCSISKAQTESSNKTEASTLTSVTEIPRDYFVKQDQTINSTDRNEAWLYLREKIYSEIMNTDY